MAEPKAKAELDPSFKTLMDDLRDHAAQQSEARPNGEQVRWFRPSNGDGKLTDFQALGDAFDRSQSNEQFIDAVKDANDPGVTGDLVATTTMIDTLSVWERAYRMRHTMRRPRAVAHALGRLKGHGAQDGVYGRNNVEYVRGILKQSRVAP